MATVLATVLFWQAVVTHWHLPPYILPGPLVVGHVLATDWPILSRALLITHEVTGYALVAAVALGLILAVIMSQSRWLEIACFPFMVFMQVTPIIAIAPLVILWVNNLTVGLLVCAWLIAFFPIMSNTMTGLQSTDPNLEDLFELYGASRWQKLSQLRLPSALPFFLAGVRIAGGLSLIGAIAAEFVAGTGGQGSGLAFAILQAGYQMNIPRLFAALVLIAVSGLCIHLALTYVSYLVLHRWHDGGQRK
jgi:NitT/TauT family transport system permease protein